MIFNRDARRHTGYFCLDEEVLGAESITDLGGYAVPPWNNRFLHNLITD